MGSDTEHKSSKKRKSIKPDQPAKSTEKNDEMIIDPSTPSSNKKKQKTSEDKEKKTKKTKNKNKNKEDDQNEESIALKDGEEKDEEIRDMDSISPIAHPLADKKLNKRVLRTVKKASKHRFIKRGVKEVVKALRKGENGLVVMAGDISPMDVLTHIPLMAEENGAGYIFVPTKESLGTASSTKRPTSCVMISESTGGSAASKKKFEEKKNALMLSEPEKAKKRQEDENEYCESYKSVLNEVLRLNEKISF